MSEVSSLKMVFEDLFATWFYRSRKFVRMTILHVKSMFSKTSIEFFSKLKNVTKLKDFLKRFFQSVFTNRKLIAILSGGFLEFLRFSIFGWSCWQASTKCLDELPKNKNWKRGRKTCFSGQNVLDYDLSLWSCGEVQKFMASNLEVFSCT